MLGIKLLFLLSLFSSSAFSATFDPDLKWMVTHTDHFTIAFHSGEEHLARRAAGHVEKIYERITTPTK